MKRYREGQRGFLLQDVRRLAQEVGSVIQVIKHPGFGKGSIVYVTFSTRKAAEKFLRVAQVAGYIVTDQGSGSGGVLGPGNEHYVSVRANRG